MSYAMHWLSTAFDGIVGFLPSLVAGLVILLVGWVVASLLGRLTRAALGRIGYDRLLVKLGLIEPDKALAYAGSRWTGRAVYVVVLLAALMQAARAWNLALVSTGIARILAYVPHLVGAAIIFGAALYFANWVRDRIGAREREREGVTQRPLVASAVRAGILALGGFMALRELQIAPEIVVIAFTATLASIALAAALAFGLGSRNVAAQVTQDWYERRPGTDGARRPTPSPPGAQPTAT
jgi:hypothetical protein